MGGERVCMCVFSNEEIPITLQNTPCVFLLLFSHTASRKRTNVHRNSWKTGLVAKANEQREYGTHRAREKIRRSWGSGHGKCPNGKLTNKHIFGVHSTSF